MQKIKIGITIGDINGVGPEVIIKALADGNLLKYCTPIIYGSSKVMAYHKNIVKESNFNFSSAQDAERVSNHKVSVINCWQDTVNINIGTITEDGGKCAHIALDRAVEDAKAGKIDAIVTAPINKKAMQLANFDYPGHTEFLEARFEVKNSLMMMVSDFVKVALVTNHVPIFELKDHITKEQIKRKLKTLQKSLKQDFGHEKPIVSILGLNPHAGDNGAIGEEDEQMIRPIIIEAKKNSGQIVTGPHSADGFFGSSQFKKPDGVLAMYHDQGLIPFKTLNFGNGVNFTAGLPVVRTSPDHGTALDIAGTNSADPSSMIAAIRLAIDLTRNRIAHKEATANPLQKQVDKKIEDIA